MTDLSSPLSALRSPLTSFLQSREWQEIQKRMGRHVERIGSVLVIRHDLPFGFHYLYAPRPNIDSEFEKQIRAYAKQSGAVFLKIDPLAPVESLVAGHWSLVVRPSFSLQPRETIFVDVQKSDAELLSQMHPKTRYNIRVAERHGVAVRALEGQAAIETFRNVWPLFSETARRDGFRLHPAEHYQALLGVSSEEFRNELWLAEYGSKVLAAAIINWFRPSGMATYLHGASTRDDKNVMAPYFLHWRIIQNVCERGFRTYDFGGIDRMAWPGVTRFKSGFGGTIHEFPMSVDCVFRPIMYKAYAFQRQLRH